MPGSKSDWFESLLFTIKNENFQKATLKKNDKVLIIDDLIATGGTAEAAAKLVDISGGNVASFIFVINLFDLNGSDNLIKKGYNVENLIEFPGH